MDTDVLPFSAIEANRSAVHRLIAAYPDRIDSGDFAGVGRLFEHGTWNSRRGREESTEYLFRNMIVYSDGTPRTRHLVGNMVLSVIDADRIEAASSIVLMQQVERGGAVLPSGVLDYRDRFVRSDDGWQFEHRDVAPLLTDFARHLRLPPPPPTGMPVPTDGALAASGPRGPAGDADAALGELLARLADEDARFERRRSVLTSVTVDLFPGGAIVRGALTVLEQPSDRSAIQVVDDSEVAYRLRRAGDGWVVEALASRPEPADRLPEPDSAAIERMIISSCRLLDADDREGFAALFADGRWNGLAGRDAVLERLTRIGGGPAERRRRAVNIVVDLDGDRATARTVLWVSDASGDAPRTVAVNDCSDRFERGEDGTWSWQERSMSPRLVDAAVGPLVW